MTHAIVKFAGAALLAGLAASPAFAIDDGPRAYFPVPVGTNNFNLLGIFQNSDSTLDPVTVVRGANLNVDAGVLQYTRAIDVGGNSAAIAMVMPFGKVRGRAEIELPGGNVITRETSSSGLGDISLLGVIGIINSPAMTKQQYVQHTPGFSLGGLLMITAPTGAYTGEKAINFGTNRWAFRFGAPLGWALGKSYLDPRLTTIEFVPSVTVYSTNTAPFRADRRTQAPLWRIEGHLTHNFNRALWGSVDVTGNTGGTTSTDGSSDNNSKTWMGAGITAGVNLSPAFGITATYGGIVAGNSNAPEGDGVRFNLRYTF